MSAEFFASPEVREWTKAVDSYLKKYFEARTGAINAYSQHLLESIRYSLFSGGKRFRPLLCLATTADLGGVVEKSLPFAAALEMLHTYSLIHDDLPCMDNDDFRRGQPTNHKKFGEPLALLAGDALLTESFTVLAEASTETADLVRILGRAAGASGMIGGQAMDMNLGRSLDSLNAVELAHTGKTAELIAAAVEGAGVIAKVDAGTRRTLREIGVCLGVCFQIKDDLLDKDQDQSPKSAIHYLGAEKTEEWLREWTGKAQELLVRLPKPAKNLERFFEFNLTRDK